MPGTLELIPTRTFGRRLKEPRGARLPVIAVTGFLGAGKSTLLSAFLESPEGANSAVIVNEFGEIGIDDALLRASTDQVTLLGNGCLCCTSRTDLQDTLTSLFMDRSRGLVPDFQRILVETSGLADPTPILQSVATDPALDEKYYLQAMITVVDAASILDTLPMAPEARRQIVVADRIVITKTDLVDEKTRVEVEALLDGLNPAARRAEARMGRVDAEFLLADGARLQPLWCEEIEVRHGQEDIRTFSIVRDTPLSWKSFSVALELLTTLRGPDLLRVKGFVSIEGCEGPIVLHIVQHLVHPPKELLAWPDADRRTRLVFVTRGIDKAAVEALLHAASLLEGKR